MVASTHPWKLVGPWYRWQRAAVPEDGRKSAPVFQKFAGGEFIQDFLANPQHSLVFDPSIDVVSNIDSLPAAAGGTLAGKLATLYATKAAGTPVKPSDATDPASLKSLTGSRLVPSDLRKLYLPSHDRHYLVVCELHCDMPGFPTVPRQEVCQAGFVVRRRQRVIASHLVEEAGLRSQSLRQQELKLAELQQTSPLREDLRIERLQRINAMKSDGSWQTAVAQAQSELQNSRAELQDWFAANNIHINIQGWFADIIGGNASKTLGQWEDISAAEQEGDTTLTEDWFPLYPLIPDPRDTYHDAVGRTIYYGIVPTAALQHDASGQARFDDVSTYEIRCFVRRHQPCPGRVGKVPDCHGSVVWSPSTIPYRLAASFDILGSANRPITIKMPDLRELAAQAVARPRGKLSPVKFVQPQHLSPQVKNNSASGGSMGGNAICFFSIPLITIIALFVLNLFLPIVVFIFQLWFLLAFRFCIPPQIKFGASLDAALAATPPGVNFDADFAVSVAGVPLLAVDLNTQLKTNLAQRLADDTGGDSGDVQLDAFSNNARAPLDQDLEDNKNQPQDPQTPANGPDYSSGLVYEPHRDPQWQMKGGRG